MTPLLVAAALQLVFDATADDRRIGRHHYEIVHAADGTHLEGNADLRVTILGVPVFTYRHRVKELWRDGCLVALDSTTKSQGHQWSVKGRIVDGVFTVHRTHDDARAHETLDACTASYAYWDPRILIGRTKLLNGQTGSYDALTVAVTAGTDESPERVRLVAPKFTIELAYRDGRWVQLHSTTAEGRHLVYEVVND